MRLKNPRAIDAAIMEITRQAQECHNALNTMGHEDRRRAFLQWCHEAERMLRNHFTQTDLFEQLRQSDREVQRIAPTDAPTIYRILSRELADWQRRFEEATADLTRLQTFVNRAGHPVVLDTSALMEGELFTEFDWHTLGDSQKDARVRLILPSLVVEELDELKRHRDGRQKTWARKVLRTLWGLHASAPTLPMRLTEQADVTVEVLLDDGWHRRIPNNDGEIIDQAAFVREVAGAATLFVSADYTQLYRAAAVGLPAVLMPTRGLDDDSQRKTK